MQGEHHVTDTASRPRPPGGGRPPPPMAAWFLYPFLLAGKTEWVIRLPAILSSTLVGVGIYLLLREHDATKAMATDLARFLYPFLLAGKTEWVIRLPAILSSTLVGVGIYFLLREHDATKARATAILYFVSPLNILFVPYTSDTPLYLFSFLSAFFFYKAVREEGYLSYILSGVFLGLSFLSKYLAVFLGASYALYLLSARKDRRRLAGILLLVLSAAPFVAQNVFWNYSHSWANVLFNMYNRNTGMRFDLRRVALHVVTQLYLVTPPVLFLLYRERKGMTERMKGSPLRVFAVLFLVPIAMFTALSTVKSIGAHWAVSFYPYLVLALFAVAGTERIAGAVQGMGVFTLAHIAILAVLLALRLSAWRNARL